MIRIRVLWLTDPVEPVKLHNAIERTAPSQLRLPRSEMLSKPDVNYSIASCGIYEQVQQQFSYFVIGSKSVNVFGKSVGDRVKIVRLLHDAANESAIVECSIVVDNDMVDQELTLHSGCIAYLLDMVTALPFILLSAVHDARTANTNSKFAMAPFAPSRSLDITYSGSAPLRSKLKIVARTVANFKGTLYVRGEIWEMDENRLVAYANHVKVMPRKPPLAATRLGFKL